MVFSCIHIKFLPPDTTLGKQLKKAASGMKVKLTPRDADMAKEMTNYTKASILAQSAQTMLAQANHNASSLLSLLQ